MKNINKKSKVRLSLLLTIVLLLGTFASFASADNGVPKASISTIKEELKEVSLNKIEKEVLENLEKEEYAEVLVYMKDQTDTKMIAQATQKAVSSQLTPYNTKLAVRRGVVEALKDTAESTQANILKYLEQEKENGNVVEYTQYHIVNMVYVKATKEVIENISYMGEVEKVYKNEFHQMEKPIELDSKNEPAADDIEWNIKRVHADQAWDLGFDGTGAVVASLDSGVDWTHPALKNKWRGYDSATGTTDPAYSWFDPVYHATLPADSDTHGTHVMGTVVGQEPDGSNKVGVAPGAKWINARVFNTAGSTTDRILLDAAEWMLHPGGDPDMAPDVVNNSWGGGAGIDDWYREAVTNWRNAGIFPVFSAGNQRSGEPAPWPGSISCPANYPESFAVAAIDKNDIRASFSKLGPSPYDETLIKPEISAPGVNIRSSIPGGYTGGYSGTSMSAPHITGTVALLLSANNSLTVDEIAEIIENTASPITDSTYPESPNFGYGYGIVDCFEAVSSVASGTGYITGKVLVEGEDSEEPVIVHEQEVTEAYAGSDIEITANISDDVSIVDVELLVKVEGKSYWMLVPMNRISGDHKDGIYKANISYDMIEEPSVIYKIRVRDYSGNTVVTEDYKISIKFGIVPDEYETDFETYPVGWILDGDWEWGEPKEGVGPVPHSGTKLVGTILDGKYNNKSDSVLVTPPIDLRDETLESTTFRFYQWHEMENNWDKGYIYVTNDYGQNWTQVGPTYTGDAKEWKEIVLNLSEYIGSPNPVFVAYRFTSDSSGVRDGWYIDDVKLVGKDEEAPVAPTGLVAEATTVGIRLAWNPSQEGDFSKYNIYRAEVPGGGESGYTLIGETTSAAFIDNNDLINDNTYYYVVTALDFASNESEYSNESSATAPNVMTIFFTNFEDDNGGFTTGVTESGRPNNWQWGVPTSGPNAALTGTNVWATNLLGQYESYHRGYIESPEITVPGNATVSLHFDYWIDAEQFSTGGTMYDYGNVQISQDNGTTWTDVTGRIGGHIANWAHKEVNLAAYSGKTIKIRFLFYSDSGGNYDGWYIDNVIVTGVPATDTNKVHSVEPVIVEEYVEEVKESKPFKEDYVEPKAFDYKLNRDKTNNHIIVEDALIEKVNLSGIPADAVVTVLETGRSVKTDPATGKFTMRHAANEGEEKWTLRAEAYGYYPKEVQVHLEEDATVNETIILDEIPKGNIVGRVFDRYYKNPAANAAIRIKEDPRIAPVVADENGNFTIPNVYEGEYTLKVTADGFEPGEIKVTVLPNQDNEVEVPLKRFVGYEEEIGYDDGTGENALVLNGAGNGLAVRFTPEQFGKVAGANIYVWDNSWPSPGGNEIGIAIFDTDANGNPINMVGSPKVVNVERGKWNFIDLSEFGFATDRDFFIATVQTKIGDNSPGTGIDESSPEPGRSYLHVGGEDFEPLADEDVDGGLMIRAMIENSVSTPVITNLKDKNYTNQDSITVTGKVKTDGKVNVYVNENEPIEVQTENLEFTLDIELEEDETTIMVSAKLGGIETEPSAPVVVIKDKVAPILEITTPLDEEKVNVELVHVIGNVFDDHFDKLLLNGEKIELDEEGNFHERVIVYEGENIITISAFDLAGNETTVVRKVYVKLEASTIENIEPAEDITLEAGDVLTVRFNGEIGGEGHFRVLPNISLSSNTGTWIPVAEVEDTPGLYEGSFTVPEGFTVNNGLIEIEFIDTSGNTVSSVAPGKITVLHEEEPQPEVPVLTNIEPAEDTVLSAGDTLEVSFNAPENGQGYFMLRLPLGLTATNNGISMTEVSPGFYKGTWVVPEELLVENLRVEVMFESEDGIVVTATATGKVSIVEPVPEGESMENLPVNAVIVGNEAFNIRYLNSNSDAQTKLINWFNGKNPVYIKLSEITIVDISGLEVEIEVLPERIMYYDANGNTEVYVK